MGSGLPRRELRERLLDGQSVLYAADARLLVDVDIDLGS